MKRFVALVAVLVVGLCSLAAAQNRTYTIEDLLKVRRVGDPQISDEGAVVVELEDRGEKLLIDPPPLQGDLRHVEQLDDQTVGCVAFRPVPTNLSHWSSIPAAPRRRSSG